jgi:hypothetical protein
MAAYAASRMGRKDVLRFLASKGVKTTFSIKEQSLLTEALKKIRLPREEKQALISVTA